MKKNSRFFVFTGLFIVLLASFTLIGLPFKKEESTAEEQPPVDYDKLARDLAVDREMCIRDRGYGGAGFAV